MRRFQRLFSLLLSLLLALGLTPSAAALSLFQKIPDPQESLGTELNTALSAEGQVCGYAVSLPSEAGATENGAALLRAAAAVRRYALPSACTVDGKTAAQPLRLTRLDPALLAAGLAEEMTPLLQQRVDAALSEDEIYENGSYRLELLQSAFQTVLSARLEAPERYAEDVDFILSLAWDGESWAAENLAELNAALLGALPDAASADAWVFALFEDAAAQLPILKVPEHYTIAEDVLVAPAPNPACYGETKDPAVIEELLQRPEAKRLIGEETLVWNRDIELFRPSPVIRYYLDETILVLVWQEVEARGCGTFCEVFIADGSQLRRRIAGDEPFSYKFESASRFAQHSNAVLALGGDFYHHGRVRCV